MVLRGATDLAKLHELSQRTHVAVDECLARLNADFDADLVRRDFSCLDVTTVRKAWGGDCNATAQKQLYEKVKTLALAAKIDVAHVPIGFKEFSS